MIKPFCNIGPKKSLQFEPDEDDIRVGNLSDADKVIDDELKSQNGERDSSDGNQDDLNMVIV